MQSFDPPKQHTKSPHVSLSFSWKDVMIPWVS